MKKLTAFFDSPSIQKMCSVYGNYWEDIETLDKIAIVDTLISASYYVQSAGESPNLIILADDHQWSESNSLIPIFLEKLDEELGCVQDAFTLVYGIMQSIPDDEIN